MQQRRAAGKSRAVVLRCSVAALGLVGYWFRSVRVLGHLAHRRGGAADLVGGGRDAFCLAGAGRTNWLATVEFAQPSFLPQQYFTTQVKEHFFLNGVTLERSWPSTLRLFIQERQTTFVLTDGRQSVVADMSGIITTTVSSTATIQERLQGKRFADTWDLPVIKTDLEGSAEVGYQALSAQDAKRLLDLHMALNRRGVKMRYF